MAKKKPIAKRIADKPRRGGSSSDWAKAAAMTSKQIEAAVASDADEAGMEMDWTHAVVELPVSKSILNMRVDRDVLDYFRKMGRGYQTRINAVLRAFVDAQQHRLR
jgi:uncharacterized protein (DUF4415 family)